MPTGQCRNSRTAPGSVPRKAFYRVKENLMRSKIVGRGLTAVSLFALGLALTACNPDTGSGAGAAAPAPASSSGSISVSQAGGSVSKAGGSRSRNSRSTAGNSSGTKTTGGSASSRAVAGSRCTTAVLRGNVGDNNPGAGQENFPLIVTNFSDHACTLDGFPGVAFVDGSGAQLGPDPKRNTATVTKITLAPGKSAWAGLSFGNPKVSGARTVAPAAILITPPDEKSSLHVDWTNGDVPASSPATLSPFRLGTGA
ncbi:DUF4232 domain-containing protein [Streptomyces sp. NPDC013172]|uniref:DUF4232 domain-containing protein n=1 Tax=unclassified Streptomyces TaxID=2593676 RepID=UPI0033D65C4E